MLYNYMRLPLSHVTHESCWQMFIVHSSHVVLPPLAKPLLNHDSLRVKIKQERTCSRKSHTYFAMRAYALVLAAACQLKPHASSVQSFIPQHFQWTWFTTYLLLAANINTRTYDSCLLYVRHVLFCFCFTLN